MAVMSDTDNFLHLARPLGPAPIGTQPSTAPLNVVIQPQVYTDHPASAVNVEECLSNIGHFFHTRSFLTQKR